jgi:hypothetical protein
LLKLRSQALGTVLKNGYGADFTTSEGGTAVLELFVSGGDAKGLKPVAAARTKRIARGTKKFRAGGKKRVVAKLAKKARKKFKRRKKLTLLVRLTETDTAGNKSVKTKHVTLRR